MVSKYRKFVLFYALAGILDSIMLIAGSVFIYKKELYFMIIFYILFGSLFIIFGIGFIISVKKLGSDNEHRESIPENFLLINEKKNSAKVLPMNTNKNSLESLV